MKSHSARPRLVPPRFRCFFRLFAIALLGLLGWSPPGAQAQSVVLTELLPVNATGVTDNDGTRQPWIELWNSSATAKAVLTSARLTDGTSTWTFPAAEIEPDGRLIVWFSGKNRTGVEAPLHTSFLPKPAGGLLELRSSANALLSSLTYPALPSDVSWGRDEAVSNAVGRYDSPTPGERNNYSGTGVTGNVVISPGSGAFTGTLQVTLALAVPDPAAAIRYTTNGATPTATSTLYTGPVTVTSTQRIRARAFSGTLLPSETETAAYLLLDSTTQTFSSSMPLAVISNFTTTAPPDTGDQDAFIWVWYPTAPDSRARFTNAPDLATRIAIDKRGSSTISNPKFNLNVEFRKARDNDDRDLPLMGMPAHSDWVFHAPYDFDRSLMHNPLAYAMSNALGRYAVRTRMAEVFIDVTAGALSFSGVASGDYFGVYNVMEKIRRGKDRVDVKKLAMYDNDALGKTGGYIFKIDRQDSGDVGFSAGGQTWAYYYPKEVEILAPQRDPQEKALTAHLNSMNTALNSASYTDPVTGYAAWIDVPGAIDHHLVNVWGFNVDALRLSGYWTKERGAKIVPGPVWDFDRAMSSTDGRDSNPAVWRSTTSDLGTDFFNYTWWSRLFTDANFYQKYVDRWQDLRRGPLSREQLEAMIDALNAEISAEAITRDLARWSRTKRSWTRPSGFLPAGTFTGQPGEVQRLKDYMQQRANFFDTQWVAPVTTSLPAGQVAPGTAITLTGPASSVIYYTLDGSDPRPSGGAVPTAANVFAYSSPIIVSASTTVRARAYKATHTALTGANNPPLVCKWSGLTQALYTTTRLPAPGDLVISEINYNPQPPRPAEVAANPVLRDNDFEFVEIRNRAADAIQLAGVQLSDAVTWQFATGQDLVIQPGGYVVVASNPAAFALRYPAFAGVVRGGWTGNLSNGGEAIRLLSGTGATLFSMAWVDSWRPASDGAGSSLAVYNPYSAEAAFSTAGNWRASSAIDGSPGAPEPNLAPEVDAGPDLTGRIDATALSATITDDGQPTPAAPTVLWSKISGPGDVNFTLDTSAATTASFSVPGTYVLRVEASDSLLPAADEVTVFAQDIFAAWLARNPAAGSATADPDGDGLDSATEFALGTNPLTANDFPVTVSSTESRLALTFTRQRAAYSTTVEVSADLQSWSVAGAGQVTTTVLSQQGDRETVELSFPNAAALKFVRMRFVMTP